jgi:hypothetical protein
LDGVLIRHDVDDLEGMSDDCVYGLAFCCRQILPLECSEHTAHSHKLLAVVATVHHERVGETLNLRISLASPILIKPPLDAK